MTTIHPVILCGGSGTRLWPRSRADRPKPFLRLLDEKTLFEATLARCADPGMFAPPIVVAGAKHRRHVEEQGGDVDGLVLIVEPQGRNTAPAIALAAARLPADAVMMVCPSDHHIADTAAFRNAARQAATLAAADWLVSFGIAPTHPETGYGYIERGAAIAGGFEIARFVEKPDLDTARDFLSEGGFDWNGGIFAFRAGAFLNELAVHRPAMARAVERAVAEGEAQGEGVFCPSETSWSEIEGESVDYAVMENTARAAVVPVAMGWSDIGNWQALRDASERDAAGNVASENAELVDCVKVMAVSDGPRISCIGLSDIVVIVDGGEVLVTTASGAQRVGALKGTKEQ